MSENFVATPRTAATKQAGRVVYDQEVVFQAFDDSLVSHVAFDYDGYTVAVPMLHVRIGEDLYYHSSRGSRLAAQAAAEPGLQVCINTVVLTGVVFARAAIKHSVNYVSAVVYGLISLVEDEGEKLAAVMALVDHLSPGRSAQASAPTLGELRATTVMRVPLRESSAKRRTGGPLAEPDDPASEIWRGVVPVGMVAGRGDGDHGLPSPPVGPFWRQLPN